MIGRATSGLWGKSEFESQPRDHLNNMSAKDRPRKSRYYPIDNFPYSCAHIYERHAVTGSAEYETIEYKSYSSGANAKTIKRILEKRGWTFLKYLFYNWGTDDKPDVKLLGVQLTRKNNDNNSNTRHSQPR